MSSSFSNEMAIWCKQWWNQDFSLGGARLQDKIENKINLKNISLHQ